MILRHAALVFLLAACPSACAAGAAALLGTWEAARTPNDERMYVRLMEKGKAEIVAEYDFELPGQPGKRRGRSTTFGKWSVKGDDVTITYAKVRDRLRYTTKASLSEIGLEGTSAALKPTGKIDPKSRIRDAILWKGPHEYRLNHPEEAGVAAPKAGPGK